MLADMIPYSTLLPGDLETRWYLHMPLLAAICLASLPSLWQSKLLPTGYWFFLGWVLVTVTYAPDPVRSLGRFITLVLVLAGVCNIASRIRNEDDLHNLLDIYLRTAAALVWVNLLAEPFKIGWVFDDEGGLYRFVGFTAQPNLIGQLMAVTIEAGLLHWSRCKWKAWLGLTMIVALIMGIMADSRTPFVCLSVAIAAWLAYKHGLKGRLAGLALLTVLLLLKSSSNPYISRGMDTYNGRSLYWAYEEHKIAQNPLFGYGYAIEGLLFDNRDFPIWNADFDLHSTLQNSYLSLCVGIGIIATGAFLFLFLRPWVALFMHRNSNKTLKSLFFLIVLPALVYGISESGIESPKSLDGLLLFISWLLAERYRKSRALQRRRRLEQLNALPSVR